MIKLVIAILLLVCSFKSFAQNIGIGNTTPSEKLDVSGNIKGDTAKLNSLKITPSAGLGRVLTSDVNGVASWQIATGAVNAKNGLTLTNDSVKLGGIVTENTMLRLNTKSLLITDTGSTSTLSVNQLSFPAAASLSAVPVTQTITAISNSTLSAVEIYVAAFGGSSITVQVKNAANIVLGTAINTYSSIFNNWSVFTFGNILLTNTQVYTLSVTATGTAQIHYDNTNPYANGISSINSTADISFKIFNTEEKHLFFLQGNKIGVNNSNPTATLDIAGNLKITDGTQAAGKILMSDATGKATWQPLTGADVGGWGTSGNAGTTPVNFIGTTDNTSLQFRINNGHAGKINTDGSVSIGRGALQNNPTLVINTAIGDSALYSNISGLNNTAVGTNTLYSNTSGLLNTAVGYSALQKNSTGNGNSSFGAGTLQNNTVGLNNTAVGFNTLTSNIGGLGNTGLGNSSLISNTTGNFNTAMGLYALLANITGSQNVGIGFRAMLLSDSGSNNIGIGTNALYSNTGGSNNVAIGIAALRNSANRSNLVAVGDSALLNNGIGAVDILDGTENTALGSKALFANNLGSLNTAVGFKSLNNNTTGVTNTATGANALFSNTTGSTNTATGSYALGSNTTGNSNSAHGASALLFNTTGSSNVAIGTQALLGNISGFSNIGIGAFALQNNIGKNNLVAIGDSALLNNGLGSTNEFEGIRNTAIGSKALYANTIGEGNTATGFRTLYSNINGVSNIANGAYALHSNTTGSNNTAIGTKSLFETITAGDNTAVGYKALEKNVSASNTAIGSQAAWKTVSGTSITAVGFNAAGSNTTGTGLTAVGYNAGSQNVSGTNNTAIGYNATFGSTFLTNASAIGANATVSSSNSLVLGNNANVGIGTSNPITKLHVEGKTRTTDFQMINGALNGGVLTSDAVGNAQWKSKILFKISGLTDTISVPSGVLRTIDKWNTVNINLGNAFFNHGSGEYFVPETAIYRITYKFHAYYDNTGGECASGIFVNNVVKAETWREPLQGHMPIEGNSVLQLNAGDRVKITFFNFSANGAARIANTFRATTAPQFNDFTIEKIY